MTLFTFVPFIYLVPLRPYAQPVKRESSNFQPIIVYFPSGVPVVIKKVSRITIFKESDLLPCLERFLQVENYWGWEENPLLFCGKEKKIRFAQESH